MDSTRVKLTTVKPKYQVTIPKVVSEAAGFRVGDLLEATAGGGVVVLRPKVVVDRDPMVERDLEAAEADVKAGRVLGPFKTAGAAMRAVKAHARRAHAHVRR